MIKTIPEYMNAASLQWRKNGRSLYCFCDEVGIDAGKEWRRMLAGERIVSVKMLFRVQSISGYSLDNLDTRYNYALEHLSGLRTWRLSHGLSQKACAEAIGMSCQSFDTLETTLNVSRCAFRADKMLNIADLLNGLIAVEAQDKRKERYTDTDTPPKKDTAWNVNAATDAEIMDKVDKVWRYAMLGGKRPFHLKQCEHGLFTAKSDSLDYVVDVRKAPFMFRAMIRAAGMVLCERYI